MPGYPPRRLRLRQLMAAGDRPGNDASMDPRMHRRVDHDGVADEVAVEEPLEIRVDGRAAGGDDADPRQRRRAGARLPPRRGPDRRGRAPPRRPPTSPPTRSRSAGRCAATPARAASTRAPRAASAARARSRRSPSMRRWRARARSRPRRSSPPSPSGCRQPAFELTGGLHATGLFDAGGRAAPRARGRRSPQRDGQGDRPGVARRRRAAHPG